MKMHVHKVNSLDFVGNGKVFKTVLARFSGLMHQVLKRKCGQEPDTPVSIQKININIILYLIYIPYSTFTNCSIYVFFLIQSSIKWYI